jgi:rsbT co-antagonist protein RsbR
MRTEEGEVSMSDAEEKKLAEAVCELSTPVLQVRKGLLIVPVIGLIDTTRARQLTEQLLESIASSRAKVVVVDITGVPAVDSAVANHLIQTANAAGLMGAHVIFTGLSPEVAQALVHIGVDTSPLHPQGDLQSGLEEAERMLGYRVVKTGAHVE